MTLRSFFVLLPSIVSGGLLAHLIWPDKRIKSILLKICLGVGIGLGLNSLLYFLYLLVFNRSEGYWGLQIFEVIVLILITLFRERSYHFARVTFRFPSRMQLIILAPAGVMLLLALVISITVSLRHTQGAWDSWMIYNRTARFIYRGGEHWVDAFSPEMYWFFHADYPPLVALNVASGWEAIGQETIRVPMMVGWAFLFGSAGLLFAGVNAYRTLGQASLAMIVLFGTSAYIETGSGQLADVPLSFFILASGVLFFMYSLYDQRELLILAGLTAGLAAWTKNEGIQFFFISLVVVLFFYRNRLKFILPWYVLGFSFPILVVAYFKIMIAPPGDLIVDLASQIGQIFDPGRHIELLQEFASNLKALGNWLLLAVYLLVFGVNMAKESVSSFLACLSIVVLQLAGYYSVFLISPHPLAWHLSALYRLLLQVCPLIIFLYFSVVRPPETIFQNR